MILWLCLFFFNQCNYAVKGFTNVNESILQTIDDEDTITKQQQHLRHSKRNLIYYGSFVQPNTYPWFTLILHKNEYDEYEARGCGGALISSEFVLTAAHCINNGKRFGMAVKVGAFASPFEKGNNGGQYMEFRTVRPERVFVHPYFKPRTFENDLALLHLDEEVLTIDPVAMDDVNLSEGYLSGEPNLWIMGFGEDETDKSSDLLKHLKVPYVANSDCVQPKNKYEKSRIKDHMMCAGSVDADSCKGDSGGALFDVDHNLLVGVVSWGQGCAVPGYPGVFSRISKQHDWIKNVVFENSFKNIPSFARICSSNETVNSTLYLSKDSMCWQIEFFQGGRVSVDKSDPHCSNKYFKTSAILGTFDHVVDKGEYIFKRCSNAIRHQCQDDPSKNLLKIYDGSLRGCEWILEGYQFQDKFRMKRWCHISKPDHKRRECPKSCGLCPPNENEFSFIPTEEENGLSQCTDSAYVEWSGKISVMQKKADEIVQNKHVVSWNPSKREHIIQMDVPSCHDFNTCGKKGKQFEVELVLDNWPTETSWMLEKVCNDSKTIVLQDKANGIKSCIEPGSYKFTIFDKFGDGMCCKQGRGGYKVYYDGALVGSGGEFKSSEESFFGNELEC